MSGAAYRHGPIEVASPGEYVLAFRRRTAGALVERLVSDIRDVGGASDSVRVGSGAGPLVIPEVPPLLRPVLEILPAQVLSVALAERTGTAMASSPESTRSRLSSDETGWACTWFTSPLPPESRA